LFAIALWFGHKMYPGFGRWTLGRALASVVTFLSIFSGVWSPSTLFLLAAVIGIVDSVLILQACREFCGLRVHSRWIYAGALLLLALQIGASFILHSARSSYSLANIGGSGFYLACASTLLGDRSMKRGAGHWITGASFSAVAVCFALNAFHYPSANFASTQWWDQLRFLFLILWVITVNSGFFLMQYERLLLDREEQAAQTASARADRERAALELKLAESQKLESIGRLAGGVAHDFNNMLTVILGYAAMCKDRLPPEFPERAYLTEIEKAGNRSREITQKLLGFSRRQIIAPVPSDLNELVEDLRQPLARLIGEDIEMKFVPGAGLYRVLVDHSQVNQILLNLAVNARDAMETGGILAIETSNATVTEADCVGHPGALPGPHVVLTVRDSGVGMDPETLAHIFEPFFTTKEQGKGTGLGLATVYGILRQNRGFVKVESELGKGTAFRIFIPRFLGGSAGSEPLRTGPATPKGAGAVLLVEDDELVRRVTAKALTTIGYTPLVAKSANEALRLCSENGSRVRLMLSDVVMPGMSGLELRERVAGAHPEIRMLFMSGYTSKLPVGEGIHFIQKPFSVDELARRIEQTLTA
jgi:signal transduction histidine kinase/CheY-like chemotaxis protein